MEWEKGLWKEKKEREKRMGWKDALLRKDMENRIELPRLTY